jgi:hypothetical protein
MILTKTDFYKYPGRQYLVYKVSFFGYAISTESYGFGKNFTFWDYL